MEVTITKHARARAKRRMRWSDDQLDVAVASALSGVTDWGFVSGLPELRLVHERAELIFKVRGPKVILVTVCPSSQQDAGRTPPAPRSRQRSRKKLG